MGTPAQGKAKIKQFNAVDAFIALLQTHLLKQAYCTYMYARFKEGTRDLQNVFAIQRFRYIEVLFQIFYYYWRGKKIARYTEEFVI